MKNIIKNKNLDVIKYFITKLMAGILSFIMISIYTYMIDPAIYGNYSLIIGVINIIISMFIGWISSSSLRYYSNYENDKKTFYSNIFFEWIIMIITSIIVIIIIGSISKEVPIINYINFVLLLFIFTSTQDIFTSIIRAARKTNFYFFIIVGQYIINIILFITLIKVFHIDIEAIFISSIISYAILTIISILYLKIYKYISYKSVSKEIQVKFLKYGLPMIGVWGVNWVLNYSDRYIIKLFFSSYEVGLYDIAAKLAENSINMLITSLSMAMMPILIEKYNKFGKEEAELEHGKFLNCYLILIIPAVIGIILIREFIYNTLISREYISGMNTIICISISMFFLGFNQFMYKLWQLKEKTNKILLFMTISVIINIILNLIFIPKYGYISASVTTLIASAISTLLTIFSIKKDFKIMVNYKIILNSIISSSVMAVFLLIFSKYMKNLTLGVIILVIAIIIYFVVLILLIGKNNIKKLLKNENNA